MFKKTLRFMNPKYRANIDIELRGTEEKPVLSICGTLYEKRKNLYSIMTAGQCIDTIAKVFDENQTIKRIEKIWKEYHLNDMHPGCIHQRAFESEPYEKHENAHCNICNYTYGHAWVYEPIPENILKEIMEFCA